MFVMAVSLYTSRVNLSVLGIEDNGIYQVVGGLVAMFSFLNGSLAGATSRFLTYEIGRGDKIKTKKNFSASLEIHFFLCIIVLILGESIGLWFLNNKLVIPTYRLHSAQIVYQFSIVACLISIIQIPYNALIIAYEKMNIFAYLGILDVVLKLLICYLLYIIPFDKLGTYGILITFVSIINITIYYSYCHKKFETARFELERNWNILKPILSFSGWDLLGNFSVMARSQGVNIVLNLFFGPVINSAAGFASSVGNAVYSFANNFMTAIRPPIVKAFSVNDFEKMQQLMVSASKISFSLMLLLSVPFIFESNYIVKLWLKTPPDYTAMFAVWDLILSLVSVLFLPLVFVIHATGKIKFMSIVNGSIWFLSVPISYILLKIGLGPTIPFILKIGLLILVVISNLYNVKRLIPNFRIYRYLKSSVFPSVITVIICIPITFWAHRITDSEIAQFFVTCSFSSISICICIGIFMLSANQRKIIISKIANKIKK